MVTKDSFYFQSFPSFISKIATVAIRFEDLRNFITPRYFLTLCKIHSQLIQLQARLTCSQPNPKLVGIGHVMMAERFKDDALRNSHTFPASTFMSTLIDSGGQPGETGASTKEAEQNVRSWFSEFVRDFSFFFSRFDFIIRSLHIADTKVTNAIILEIDTMLNSMKMSAYNAAIEARNERDKFQVPDVRSTSDLL